MLGSGGRRTGGSEGSGGVKRWRIRWSESEVLSEEESRSEEYEGRRI